MSYTGVLEVDATEEQIKQAPKTVQIITEVNGHQYIESFDGTKGFTVLIDTGEATKGKTCANGETIANFLDTWLNSIPEEIFLMVLMQRMSR